MPLQVAVVGWGLAGQILHAPLIEAAGLAIATVVTSRVDEVKARCPGARVVASIDAVLDDPAIDLVVICSPSSLHVEHAMACLKAGKHVLVDKPVSADLAGAEAVVAAGKAAGRLVAVFHNRRFDADFLTIEKLLGEGRLGTVFSYEHRWDRWVPAVQDRWKEREGAANGIFYDLGPHMVHQTLALFGWPEWIEAEIFAQRPGAVVSDAFELRMGKGALRIHLGVGLLVADANVRYRINGDRASFVKSGLDPQEPQLKAGMAASDPAFGWEDPSCHGVVVTPDGVRTEVPGERGRWLSFYRGLRAAIEDGTDLPVPMSLALDVVRLMDRAQEASALHARVML